MVAEATAKPAENAPLDLPDPRIAEGRPVLIYDGHCKFCRKQVARVHSLDGDRLSYISLHDPWVTETYPDLTHDQLMEEMVLIEPDGRRYGGAAAFKVLSRKLPPLWILAPVMHIPFSLPVWSWMYRQVARQRYRWGRIEEECEGGTCSVHFK